jgi:SAM-dependent methyltransferase
MSLYDKVLGLPFVYNRVRPLVVGGIDMAPVYERLGVRPGDTVLDVGCGTGVALEHLGAFAAYVGVDTDPRALRAARERRPPPGAGAVEFSEREVGEDDVRRIAPDVAVLAGLLHHVDDAGCVALLRSLRASPRLRRVVTQDITLVPNRRLNNLFSIFDRGQHCRHPGGYEALAREAGFRVVEGALTPAARGNERIVYWVMTLEPAAA